MFLIERFRECRQIRWNKLVYEEYSERMSNNMIIVGPSGCGKNTFVSILLKNIYGPANDILRIEEFQIKNYGNNTQSVSMTMSKYTMYFRPVGSALDKYIIQDVVLNFVNCNDVRLTDQNVQFKTVVVKGFDRLSYHSQASLRRILEEKSKHCRFILVGDHVGTLIEPVRRRCQVVSLSPPTHEELRQVCLDIAGNGGGTGADLARIDLVEADIRQIVLDCQHNLPTLLWMLEMKRINVPYRIIWHDEVGRLCDMVLVEQVPSLNMTFVKKIRMSIGKLFISNIDIHQVCEEIFRQMYHRIMHGAGPEQIRSRFGLLATINGHVCEYNCRIQNSTRYILHLEAMMYRILHSVVRSIGGVR